MNFPSKGRGASWMLRLAIVSFPLLDALTSKNEISQDRGEARGYTGLHY